jgi:acyl-CoA hydrolase
MSRDRTATVVVNEFCLKQPVRVGDILSLFAALAPSITVVVEGLPNVSRSGQYIKARRPA